MTSRTIICVRHGESTFNAAWRAAPVDPLHFDAPLSETGRAQVRQRRAELAGYPVELVLTSPLTRALQTAVGLFGEHPCAPPIEVSSLLRERLENSCDRGRPPAALAAEFSSLRLDHLADEWWHAEGVPDSRGICIEPVSVVQARAADFRSQVFARPERVIAVVGHGTFFRYLTGSVLGNCEFVELKQTADQAGAG